jgi:drug/metabolite transporter (DMT)-like permease
MSDSARPPGARPTGWLALPALLAGAMAIGFSPIFVRLSEVGPSATAFWRIALALPVLAVWMAARRGADGRPVRRPRGWGDALRLMSAGLFFGSWKLCVDDPGVLPCCAVRSSMPLIQRPLGRQK